MNDPHAELRKDVSHHVGRAFTADEFSDIIGFGEMLWKEIEAAGAVVVPKDILTPEQLEKTWRFRIREAVAD